MLLWLVSIVISGYYYSTVTSVSLLSFVSRSFGYCNLQQYKCIHCLSYPKLHFFDHFQLWSSRWDGYIQCNASTWCTTDAKMEGNVGQYESVDCSTGMEYWNGRLERLKCYSRK